VLLDAEGWGWGGGGAVGAEQLTKQPAHHAVHNKEALYPRKRPASAFVHLVVGPGRFEGTSCECSVELQGFLLVGSPN
jgi:hypothetical protein